jgi:hypothetical protein
MNRRQPISLPILLIVVSFFWMTTWWPAPAQAQSSEAQLHYELGEARYAARRYNEALEHFLASYRLAPTVNLAFNIAQVYGLLRRPAESFNWYETYLTSPELDAETREQGERARDSLLGQIAVVAIETSPSGAELFVDRTDIGSEGTSPRRVATSPGQHRLVARLEGHHEASVAVEAVRGEVIEARLDLTPILGRLEVGTTPADATVRVSGQPEVLGNTPLSLDHAVGSFTLEISLEGYIGQTREVTIVENETARLEVALSRPAQDVAVLSVNVEPSGAEVLLDGEGVGQAPLVLDDLDSGSRSLEVRAEGRTPWTGDLLLEPGSATRVQVSLADPDDRMWNGWRWIGYGGGGAILLAGAALGVMALVHRNAFYESDNPTRDDFDRVGSEALAADILIGVGALSLALTMIFDLIYGRTPESTATVETER